MAKDQGYGEDGIFWNGYGAGGAGRGVPGMFSVSGMTQRTPDMPEFSFSCTVELVNGRLEVTKTDVTLHETSSSSAAATPSVAPTTITLGPLTKADVIEYQGTLRDQIQPCLTEPSSSFSAYCTEAIYALVTTLEEFDSRLTPSNRETRASIAETISDLEYWRDECMKTTANSPERRACVGYYMLYEARVQKPIVKWADENR
ncbi:hypothetical protein CA951_02850 [Rhodococcus sp. NCIMB 12038]|nr:hypothetical protein CA951_02850 [Rhodococcus sp. NCIMB 12038]